MADVENEARPAKRGQDAWLATLDEVASRNAAVTKAGKEQRAERERQNERRRRATERAVDDDLARRKPDFKT